LILTKEGYEDYQFNIDITEGENILAPTKLYSEAADLADIPVISLDDTEIEEDGRDNNVSGLLSASNDVFLSTAAFTFGPNRFRIRGYDSQNTTFQLSGIEMNDPETGRVFWSIWGGLNDVLRNREISVGLGSTNYSYGGIGGANQIDIRATKARAQTRVSYASSNRSYRNRIMGTYSTGLRKDGWAFTIAASRRWAEEGFVEGTTYDAYSYFIGIGKRLNDKHELNLTAFAAPTKRGGSTASILEMYDLAGTNYYNPYWGFQDGKKRNSRVTNSHQPVVILNHDWKISNKTTLSTAIATQFGRYGKTYIDWFDGRNPDPTYYRRMPSYIVDPVVSEQVAEKFRTDVNTRQIDWAYMYNANRLNQVSIDNVNGVEGNTVSGLRSNYIL
ncbi:MAG: TonB-dependent receptor, partial [Bacteroidota bacterium]